jgi:hypothetical protein
MALKLLYYGQNDSMNCTPDIALIGDPGTDQQNLTNAKYLGGMIMALKVPSNATGVLVAIVPCDADSMVPFATLLNGPGEFSGAIGPSGSKKAPVVRALWQGNVNVEAFDSSSTYTVGTLLYCGGTTNSNIGMYCSVDKASVNSQKYPVGICTHKYTAAEPWVGVASLL